MSEGNEPEMGAKEAVDTQETLNDLQGALEEARQKAAENWDLFLRTRADADNMRRRALLDIENAHKYSVEKFARELLAIVDSLEHALAAIDSREKESDSGKAFHEGINLTHKLLLDTLEKFGIKAISALGEAFDPKLHEALSTMVNHEVEPNRVLVVVQKGFLLQDRLLRPARVIVSKQE